MKNEISPHEFRYVIESEKYVSHAHKKEILGRISSSRVKGYTDN